METIISPDLDETIANPWALTYKDRVDWCVAALDAGDVDAVVAPMASAWSLVLDDCKHRSIVSTISIPSDTFVGVFPGDADDAFVQNVSVTIRHLVKSPAFVKARDAAFRYNEACEEADDLVKIDLASMAGLFLVFGASAALALLLHVVNRNNEGDPIDNSLPQDADAKVHLTTPRPREPLDLVGDAAEALDDGGDFSPSDDDAGARGPKLDAAKPRRRKHGRRTARGRKPKAFAEPPKAFAEPIDDPRDPRDGDLCSCGAGVDAFF